MRVPGKVEAALETDFLVAKNWLELQGRDFSGFDYSSRVKIGYTFPRSDRSSGIRVNHKAEVEVGVLFYIDDQKSNPYVEDFKRIMVDGWNNFFLDESQIFEITKKSGSEKYEILNNFKSRTPPIESDDYSPDAGLFIDKLDSLPDLIPEVNSYLDRLEFSKPEKWVHDLEHVIQLEFGNESIKNWWKNHDLIFYSGGPKDQDVINGFIEKYHQVVIRIEGGALAAEARFKSMNNREIYNRAVRLGLGAYCAMGLVRKRFKVGQEQTYVDPIYEFAVHYKDKLGKLLDAYSGPICPTNLVNPAGVI